MLQGWLDQKLPDIIERRVKAELLRAIGTARSESSDTAGSDEGGIGRCRYWA